MREGLAGAASSGRSSVLILIQTSLLLLTLLDILSFLAILLLASVTLHHALFI